MTERTWFRPSVVALVFANAAPLAGVLSGQWTIFSVLLLYWCENVIVGGFNVLRMLTARSTDVLAWTPRLFMIPFFMVHYGMFTYVHGELLLALFGGGATREIHASSLVGAVLSTGLGGTAGLLALSHGFSFVSNYLIGGEFRRASLPLLMFQPYGRVMVLHVTVLVGGFLVQTLGAPILGVVVLIVLKTALDLYAHVAERRKLGAPAEPVVTH